MPGRRRLWTYSAFPVTLARAATRGIERPTDSSESALLLFLPSIVAKFFAPGIDSGGKRLAQRAAGVDAQQFGFVGRGAAGIANQLGFRRGSLARAGEQNVIGHGALEQ